jgi:hypothetical protein
MESLNNEKFCMISKEDMGKLKGGNKILGYEEVVQYKDSNGNLKRTSEQLYILWIGTSRLRQD